MTLLVILLALAVGMLGVIVFGLLRTHAEILRALDRAGVPLDGPTGPVAVAPDRRVRPADPNEVLTDLVGKVPGGGPVKVALDGSHHTLLAFLSSGCRTCHSFWERFRDPALDLPGTRTRLVIVGQDPGHDSEAKLAELAPPGVRTVCSSDAWQAHGVPGSPYFVLVDGASRRAVGSGTATSWDQVKGLLARAVEDDTRPRSVDETLAEAGIGPGHASLYPKETGPQ